MLSSYHLLRYLVHWHGYRYWDPDVGDSSGLVGRVDNVCLNTSANEEEEVDDPKDDGKRKQGPHEIS